MNEAFYDKWTDLFRPILFLAKSFIANLKKIKRDCDKNNWTK